MHRVLLMCVAIAASGALAQVAAPDVTSTVIVTGTRAPDASIAGPLADRADIPAQVEVISSALLSAPGVHRLSDALSRSASIAENYPAIGYYENFSIRGFTLDRGSAYRINGFVVPGEFHTALDNKEQVEVLKGIGILTAGVASAGGLVNFVTKRPADIASVRFVAGEREGHYAALDYGRAASADRAGVRVNLAGEAMRPYATHAEGNRFLLSAAFDSSPTGRLRVTGDLEIQRRSQPAVPGFQLLGGTELPPLLTTTNINQQPWSRPVENRGVFAALRSELALSATSSLTLGASLARARIDDNLAFPFGCNDPPVQYFCRDGSYVLYDYHARETRDSRHLHSTWLTTLGGEVRHRIAAGAEVISRRLAQRELYSATLYDAAGRGLTGNLAGTGLALPAPIGEPADRPRASADQSAVFVGDRLSWRDWELLASLRRAHLSQRPDGGSETRWLPGAALVKALDRPTRLYASFTTTLEFGSETPLTAGNAGSLLAPRRTSAYELGFKHLAGDASLSAALFRMQRPYELTDLAGNSFAGLGAYRQAGQEIHAGLEGHAGIALSSSTRASLGVALTRARARGTGEPALEGIQLQNIARFRSVVEVNHAFLRQPLVAVSASWIHSGPRNARRDGLVTVRGYDRLDAGVILSIPQTAIGNTTLALRITNLANRRYWRDVSEAYSADLLFPGAPREIWLGLTVQRP